MNVARFGLWRTLLAISTLLVACADIPVNTGVAESIAPVRAVAPAVGEDGALDLAQQSDWGAELYLINCAACHQLNGEGNLRFFPALNGNALVTAQPPTALIQTVLYGRGLMPAFAGTLSDQEIAAVLSYVRNAWSNEAPLIEARQISQAPAAPSLSSTIGREEVGQTPP